jgi:hypothetical protein
MTMMVKMTYDTNLCCDYDEVVGLAQKLWKTEPVQAWEHDWPFISKTKYFSTLDVVCKS